MSSDQAIAAVSATLRNLLTISLTADPALVDTGVTVQPPDKARGANTANQVNLFLYHANLNAAWRNQDMPLVKPGEAGFPPLPLNLYYLVTVYGRNDDDVFAHRLLGAAMRTLHDHAVLGAEEIKSALPGNDLFAQVEHVRLSWQPLSMDDFSKLWTTFQTPYRVSASLEAAVVLLESRRSARAPLPVLTRGPADQGVRAQADLTPPFPAIEAVTLPRSQTGALLGDTVTVTGYHLDGTALFAEFSHPRLTAPIEVGPLPAATPAPPPGSPLFQVGVPLLLDAPTDAARWPAGTYALTLRVQKAGEPDRLTNAAPLSLMPRLDALTPTPATRDAAGDVTLTAQVIPLVRPDQAVALLLGDRLVPAQSRALLTDPLTFLVTAAPTGVFRVRLRVDGVDSPLVQRGGTPPTFDPNQQVTIQ